MLSDHGRLEKYTHEIEGYNTRLDGLQSAILSIKLRYLDKWNQKRRRIADYYLKNIDINYVILPQKMRNVEHVYHLFVIRVGDRDSLLNFLGDKGIGATIHYPVPVHQQPAYDGFGGDLSHTERVAKEILSLPMYPELTKDEIHNIIDAVREFHE